MPDRAIGTSPQVYARGAGLIYLIIAIMAPFVEFFVRQRLIVPGDVPATAANIVASQSVFRAGFASDLVVFVIEVALAAVLYVLFSPVSRTLALVMSFARLAMATMLGFNLLNMLIGRQLLTSAEYAAAFDQGQRQALAFVFLNAQSYGYGLGMVFFSLHLAVLGYLVYRSGFLPPEPGHPVGGLGARLPGQQLHSVPRLPVHGNALGGRRRGGPHRRTATDLVAVDQGSERRALAPACA